jgi:hypothetical protein
MRFLAKLGKRLLRGLLGLLVVLALIYVLAVSTKRELGLQAPKTGIVLDAETGQPLAGVYVVARWHEFIDNPLLIGDGRWWDGGCVYQTIVRTDSQGIYRIPATYGKFNVEGNLRIDRSKKYFWDLYAYSKGYGMPNVEYPSGIGPLSYSDNHPTVGLIGILPVEQGVQPILLEKNTTPPAQRLWDIGYTSWRFACKAASEDHAQSDSIAEQFYAEAYAAACIPQPNNAAVQINQFRQDAVPPLPPTSQQVDEQVAEILKHYRLVYPPVIKEPVSEQDAQQLCNLLVVPK